MPASRIPAVSALRLPAAPAEAHPALGRLAEFAERILNAPLAIVSLAGGRSFSSPVPDVDPWHVRRHAPLSRSLCRVTAQTGAPLVIADARAHPAVRENPTLWLGEAAYAGVPILAGDGSVLGVLCVVDSRPRAWTPADVEALADLAAFAALALDRRAPTEAGFVGSIEGARGRLSLKMLEKAVETMQIGVTITDVDGRILYTNPAEARMHGYSVDELRGKHARIFAPPEHARPLPAEAMQDVTSWNRETVNVRSDGSTFPVLLRSDVVKDSRGRPIGLVTCCEDVTTRREMERQLLRSAFYDDVTGLPNRGLFTHRLELAVDRERRGEGNFAVLAVGLDRLQLVSDSLGRAAADELLGLVSTRLRGCVGSDKLVAHVARDEFAVLLDDIDGFAETTRVAACVQEALGRPFALHGAELFTGAGVGIALSYTGYEHAEDALRDAAIAMYRSRDARAGHYEVFDRDMHAQVAARLRMETELRRGLERGELRVHYQPIIKLGTGRIAGFEALARWEHPQRGLVLPDEFIPLAEETGLILPLGIWVLEEACRQLRRWHDAAPGGEPLTLAVNLSARQFLQGDLVERVEHALSSAGVPPHTLKLEITESVLMQHTDTVTATLSRLKALGVQLHIDDFGTGYSSLGYLHRLPLDALKIDRSFVSPDGANLHLVRTIVALAHALGVAVVTEGIESAEVLTELRSLNCEFGQGYLFSQPLPSDAIDALIATAPRW
ncbi:MAG TPA: EAL domain-containing protein [Longimicrobium sp.]|jgi:PAS domain S-box-containing protein/diguanylate cyclase (GGDEF)-like protein